MRLLLLPGITVAIAAGFSTPVPLSGKPHDVSLQANFVYGTSGGTSVDAYVQSSLDNAVTWWDVANFHFTTSSGVLQFNLFSGTPVTTQRTPTTGTLAANTANDGIFGPLWRVQYVTVGTYAGTTTLDVQMGCNFLGN